jgi:hypothetical protein
VTLTFSALDEGEKGKDASAAGSASKVTGTERLELFAPGADDLVPARVEGRDAVLLLKRETRDQILAKLQAVRDAKPPTAEPTAASKAASPEPTERPVE